MLRALRAPIRRYSTRPHPLATKVTPRGPVPAGRTPPNLQPKQQRFSILNLILLATLTGSITYVAGLRAGTATAGEAGSAGIKKHEEPTAAGFAAAMKELEVWLPQECRSQDLHDLLAHGYSEWSNHIPTGLPGAVLFPRSTEDVVKIVKIAARYSIPLLPFSGGTSLEGNVLATGHTSNPAETIATDKIANGEKLAIEDLRAGLAWSIDFAENMDQIVEIHADDLDVVVQPGVGYEALNLTLKEQGIPLFFPVDPAPGAMIGGMIGTGASGTNAVRYGTMRENVINLTVVLPSGEVIKTRQRAKKSSAGPDLSKLFVGSEGTLGIIVEATLKLSPLLPSTVAVASFPTIQDAADACRDVVQQGVGVSCVELLDDSMMHIINKKGGGVVWEEKPTLFFKFAGTPAQMKNDIERTKAITKTNKGSKFTFAKSEREAEEIWYSRKVALLSAIDFIPGCKCWVTDVCVPISNFPQLVAETQVDLKAEGIVGPIVGHAGDGNFHALLLYSNDEEHAKVEGIVHRMVARAQRLDGTCTGEHGVGLGKREYLDAELGPGTVKLLRGIKQLLDPKNIMASRVSHYSAEQHLIIRTSQNPSKLLPDEGPAGSQH